jgi:NADH-quinone oxidoreductase subunit N
MEINMVFVLPEIFLTVSVLLLMLMDIFTPDRNKNAVFMSLCAAVTVIAMLILLKEPAFKPEFAFNKFFRLDFLAVVSKFLILISTLFTVFLSRKFIEKFELKFKAEYYYTILMAALGGMLLVSANELATLFVSLEVMSISIYIVTAIFKNDYRGKEAALKYFILGSVGSGFLVFGFAILYALAGTTQIDTIKMNLAVNFSPAVLLAMAMVGAGFLFKVGIVPLHMWVPDVYEGAPTPVSSFMSSAVKLSAFIAFMRIFYPAFAKFLSSWEIPFEIFAAVTMVAGSLMALNQKNLKRMLAYSSIAHSGILLSAFLTASVSGTFSIIFYLSVYVFMNIAAFALISTLTGKGYIGENVEDWGGLFLKNPLLATIGIVVFLSLAGIPPFAGFFAKFYVILALVRADHIILALIVVLSSLISLYFYLKPVVFSFMREKSDLEVGMPSFEDLGVLILSSAVLIIFGILPSLLVKISVFSVASFLKT